MANHALRGAMSAWMFLIALRTVGTAKGSGALSSLFGELDLLVQHALSPNVPAIPNRAAGFSDQDGNYHPYIPGYLGGGTTTAPGAGSSANPDFEVVDPPPPGQHNPAYDTAPGGHVS